ncbi:unnamed protein product [Caenorhabditis brenneri]
MMIAAPTTSSKRVEDGGNFSADSKVQEPLNSDDEQLDDTPFLSHQLPDDHESFSEKFLRNILTHDYQNLMPRRREKFVEITKTVTVTEIVNGAPDKHPSSCEVKVTNVSPAGPHPVNVSIKHLHEKWHSCEELDKSDDGGDLGKGTVIRIEETHKPFNYTQKKQHKPPTKFVYEDVVNTKMESSARSRPPPSPNSTLFNRSSDNIIDLEFRHPILVETSEKSNEQKVNGSNATRRRFADLRKKVSTTTKTSVTETEKVTTTRRSSSAHSTSSKRSYSKPEVHTLYYRKFVDEETKGGDDDSSDSGSVIIHRNSVTRRSRSADPLQNSPPMTSPIAPPRKRLGREESLHYYRDDEEVIGEQIEKRRVTVRSPEPGNTSVSMNDTAEGRNITAGITSISMNDSCTDTSFESRFSTIPRARSSPPGTHRVNHIHVNVIGPIRTPETERRHRVVGRVGDDVTMDIIIERRRSSSTSRRGSHISHGSMQEAPPKPPRRSKYEENIRIGDPIATSTPMTTIERKQTREERISVESGQSSRKSTRSSRPPDINIIECETFLRETRSPARTPATPIVVINQTPSSRRGSQDLLGEPGQRRRKSTVTDIDWYAAFNMKDPSSPTKPVRPPFASHLDERKSSRDVRRRASDSSMIGLPPADIDLNQIFSCTVPPENKKDEKCQCNACRLIRMSEAERNSRIERASRSRQSRSFTKTTEYEIRSSTLPSRHRTSPVKIELEEVFNPKPQSHSVVNTKPPTPPNRRRHAPPLPSSPTAPSQSSIVDESPSHHQVTTSIDRKQVTPVATNSRESGPELHENTRNQLLNTSDDWVGQMLNDANEWENRVSSRKSSVLSTSSSTARKVSVARRISVDELKKPEKRKSREAVPLPPSDVTIDDIFTALTPKKEEGPKESVKRTFIVTRKQRAQDVDIIDFEKDREQPVAPPRTKNTHLSEATITMSDTTPEVSTASINLDDVFSNDNSSETTGKNIEEDEKIRRRIEEFNKTQEEKEIRKEETRSEDSTRKKSIENTNISMDDVFNPKEVEVEIPFNETEVTSTATIQLGPSESNENKNEETISETELDHQYEASSKETFAITTEDVENDDKFSRTSAVDIDLDKVFVEGKSRKDETDDSDEKIRRGIAEFEKSKQEKDAQRSAIVVESHSTKHLFDESDISMDDVFNTSRTEYESADLKKPANFTEITSDTITLKNESNEDEEEKRIQKRIEEFKKAIEEKEHQSITESHSTHKIFEESNISMDDVFNSEHQESEATLKKTPVSSNASITMRSSNKEKSNLSVEDYETLPPSTSENREEEKRTSSVSIDLDKVFVDHTLSENKNEDVDEKIRRGIAEFERSKQEKEMQRTGIVETSHSSIRILDNSNISMDDVFHPDTKHDQTIEKTTEEIQEKPDVLEQQYEEASKETFAITTDDVENDKKENRTSAVSIDLDKVFVQGTSRSDENEDSDEKIRRGIAEFEKSKQEKEAQRSAIVVESHSTKHLFDESDISMDDVFNTSHADHKPVDNRKPEEKESSSAVISTGPKETASASFNVDDEEDERIQRRIEEFKKTTEEKEIQVIEESHSTHRIFDESNISMDDVFNTSDQHASAEITLDKPQGSSTVINLDNVFLQETSTNVEEADDSDEKIRRGIAEFEKSMKEKEIRRSEILRNDDKNNEEAVVETELDHQYEETSKETFSMTTNDVELDKKAGETSPVSIDLDKVFVQKTSKKDENEDSDEKIRRGIAEFEKSKQEKEAQRSAIVVESHSTKHLFGESDISMDDVFKISRSEEHRSTDVNNFAHRELSDDMLDQEKPSTDGKVTSTAGINLDDVFVSNNSERSQQDMVDDSKNQRGIAEFDKTKREKESQKSTFSESSHTIRPTFDESNISLDDVFNSNCKHKSSDPSEKPEVMATSVIKMRPSEKKESVASTSYIPSSSYDFDNIFVGNTDEDPTNTGRTKENRQHPDDILEQQYEEASKETFAITTDDVENDKKENRTSAVSIDLDKVFVQGTSRSDGNEDSDEKIRRGIAEFEKSKQEKEAQRSAIVVESHSTKHLFDESDISMDDVFNTSRTGAESINMKKKQKESSPIVLSQAPSESISANINLDDVFSARENSKISKEEEGDEHIRKRIEEFKRTTEEKEARKETESHSSHKIIDEADISMDDVFNTPRAEHQPFPAITKQDEKESSSVVLPKESTDSSEIINLDNLFIFNDSKKLVTEEDNEDEHIRRRIEEFKRAAEEKESRKTSEHHSSRRIFDESNISMDDVFITSASSRDVSEKSPEQSNKPVFETSSISLEDVFNNTSDSGFVRTTSEVEKTKTTTTTRTETTTDSYTKKSVTTLEDLFGPQTATPPVISVSAISFDSNQPSYSPTPPPRAHQNLSSLLVPGKFNESMMSNTSTISLDDSFNNSFVKSGSSNILETKLKKPLTLPVDNWIDNLAAAVTEEATKEAPKTPKSAIENYFRSPTRISQEIKYEWVANLVGDNETKTTSEEKEGHQSEEEHLQKQDNTWVSSVVYRPTLETSAYTLRSSQLEPEHKTEIDMDRVFDECLMGKKKKDDEECECSACRLTEQEMESIQRRKIELENLRREERQSVSKDSEGQRHVTVLNPSEFSIDDVFNQEVPLSIQTDNAQVPSTSSPPLQSTRTYYISPKISETVTTTHQWKDADISMDEIFSPVSSTTNENRRFSNFYEDRSGWDTIGSEDSGVMSGGDRGRRRSTRITDHVIDEAFKGIFDAQPTTSTPPTKAEITETQYDDYYITSLHQEDADASSSDVDGDNLDVSQFVDDILGKSMDEAAFLSSTKSLRDHTDTSIDRKKSTEKMHSYYRTRTDTSMDRRVKPEVINEDLETIDTHSHDEILKLVFVDPSDPSISKSESRRSLTLPRTKSTTKPSDEELLEIEIKPDYFLIKGSYSLLISKSDPLGIMLQKLREQNDSLATLDFSLTRKLKKLLLNCIRERAGLDMTSASSKYEGLLSSRGQSLIESIDYASATFLKMNVDKYEPTRNPNGVVNFCTAENNICTPLLEERFKHLELFFPNTEHLVRYPPAGGWPEAREVLIKYFKEFMGARVTIDELALTPSTRTGYDVTSYCLFEQDDILLTNGPIYTGTISNVQEKAQCQVVCVETDLAHPRLDVKMYEAELNRQLELENTVSGVIIVNPHNPLGVTFPPEEVVNLCNWAASKNLHVVIDEVFANCVFDKTNSKFRPFLSYRHRVHRPENVAWLWSVSKDFGLPGLKFAVIHSANEGLRKAATKLQMYYPCSPFVQDFAINLLSDSDWLREFHAEVNRRIAIHYRYTAQNLERLEIPFVPAQAGIFVFADFSKHLSSNDAVGELELFDRIAAAGVMLTPGVHQKCHVFGWFRIVFACTKEELEEGFRRLFTHLGSHLHPVGTVQYDN